MRANYIRGVVGLTKHKLGVGLVKKNEFEERLKICLDCEYLKNYNKELKKTKCGICGCFIRPKLSLRSEKCPKGLWE